MKYLQQTILTLLLLFTPLIAVAADSCKPDADMVQLIKDLVAHPNLASAIKKNVDLAEVWKDLEDSGEADLNNDENVLDLLINVPRIKKSGGFRPWFDKLSQEQAKTIMKNKELKEVIEAKLRWPGGEHEWCMVCKVLTFKKWGISVQQIHDFRTKTKDLVWTHPVDGKPGGHLPSAPGGLHGYKTFHNELQAIIEGSTDLNEFKTRLEKLRKKWKIKKSLMPSFDIL